MGAKVYCGKEVTHLVRVVADRTDVLVSELSPFASAPTLFWLEAGGVEVGVGVGGRRGEDSGGGGEEGVGVRGVGVVVVVHHVVARHSHAIQPQMQMQYDANTTEQSVATHSNAHCNAEQSITQYLQ